MENYFTPFGLALLYFLGSLAALNVAYIVFYPITPICRKYAVKIRLLFALIKLSIQRTSLRKKRTRYEQSTLSSSEPIQLSGSEADALRVPHK